MEVRWTRVHFLFLFALHFQSICVCTWLVQVGNKRKERERKKKKQTILNWFILSEQWTLTFHIVRWRFLCWGYWFHFYHVWKTMKILGENEDGFVSIIGIHGQCEGGIWSIEDTTIGSFTVSWRYNNASNKVQFLLQGTIESIYLIVNPSVIS